MAAFKMDSYRERRYWEGEKNLKKNNSQRTFKVKFLTCNVFVFYKNLLCRLRSSCSRHNVNNDVKCNSPSVTNC